MSSESNTLGPVTLLNTTDGKARALLQYFYDAEITLGLVLWGAFEINGYYDRGDHCKASLG